MGLPRILRNNDRVEDATITSSGEATGFPDDNVTDWKDYTLWTGDSAQSHWLKADAGSQVTANCFAIAGHNLNTEGVTRISLDGSNDDAAWTEIVADFAPPNGDDTIARFFTQETWRYWRLDIDNNAGGAYDPEIGIWYVGNYLELPRAPRTPHDPDHINDKSNIAVGGQGHRLGVTLDYSQRKFNYNTNLATQTFITNSWLPFRTSYRNSNFVWCWDYENHLSEAYLMGMERPEHTTPYHSKWRDLSFQLVGRLIE